MDCIFPGLELIELQEDERLRLRRLLCFRDRRCDLERERWRRDLERDRERDLEIDFLVDLDFERERERTTRWSRLMFSSSSSPGIFRR